MGIFHVTNANPSNNAFSQDLPDHLKPPHMNWRRRDRFPPISHDCYDEPHRRHPRLHNLLLQNACTLLLTSSPFKSSSSISPCDASDPPLPSTS